MAGAAALSSAATAETALRDAQVDEYYADVSPQRFAADIKSLVKNPYPGLRPFKASESIVFFGREGLSGELIERLSHSRFLAVLGASGTGKSSLVRAGLLTTLETLPGRQGAWKTVICRPGKNPFGNLSRAINAANILPQMNEFGIWKILSGSSYGYDKLYEGVDHTRFNTLIVIDQFEEIFRYRNDNGISGKNDAGLFVKMLIETSRNASLNTYVLITMRSEYIGDCIQMPQLVDAINNNQYIIPRLNQEEIADTIKEPVKFSNGTTAQGYAEILTGEIGDGMDQLPVLQHVMMRAYEHALNRTPKGQKVIVSYEDYSSVGGMATALDKHAVEIFSSLTSKQQQYCKILFQCITDRSTDGRGIRRPLPYRKILAICQEKDKSVAGEQQIRTDLDVVINAFRKDNTNFLMPPPHVPLNDEQEIDISHESLMRIWTLPQKWIEEESKDAVLLIDLIKRDKNDTISGGKLLVYQEWLKNLGSGSNWAFLYKPADKTDEQYSAEFEESKEFIRRSVRRRKAGLIWIAAIAAVIVLGSAALVVISLRSNELGKKLAEIKRQSEIINTASNTIRIQNEKAGRDLIEIQNKNRELSRISAKTEEQNNLLTKQKAELNKQRADLANVNEQLAGRFREAIVNKEKLSREVYEKSMAFIELEHAQQLTKQASHAATNLKNLALAIRHSEKSLSIPVNDPKREDIKAYLALVGYQYYLNSGRLDSNRLQAQIYSALYNSLKDKSGTDTKAAKITGYQSGSDHLASGAISMTGGNGPVLYMTSEDQKLYGYDLQGRKTILSRSFTTGNRFVHIEANGKGLLAINTLSKKLLLVNPEKAIQERILYLTAVARSMKFSDDGLMLYVYCMDSSLTVFNVADYSQRRQILKIKLEDIAISRTYIYGLTPAGQVVRWKLNTNSFISPEIVDSDNLNGSARAVVINCTADDRSIAWGNDKGQVFLKKDKDAKAQYLTRFSGPVSNISFSSISGLLAISGFDKTIQVFNRDNLQSEVPLILTDNTGPVSSVFFQATKNGREELIAVVSPGLVKTYPMDLPGLACMLNKIARNKIVSKQDIDMYLDKESRDIKLSIECQ